MRIHIDANPIGPLKVLSELPDTRLAILEGLNGIGKTLTVRLLELCTGRRPYALKSPAWVSLRNGLGEFTVSVSGLHDGREIRWHADSRNWEQTSDDGLTPVQFREITVDGHPATMDDVRALLAVHRVGGDEGIVETLARRADEAAETVRRWGRRYADHREGPLAQLEAAVADTARLLGTWSSEDYRGLAASAGDARAHVVRAAKDFEAVQQKRDELASALDLRDRLGEMRQRAPDLASRLRSVDDKIMAMEAEREALQRKVRTLAGQLAAAEPLLKEMNNARRTLRRNRDYLSLRLNAAATMAAALGIPADTGAVGELISQLQEQVAELNTARTALDAVPTMRTLLDQLTSELTQAEAKGLGDQIAVDDPVTEVTLTVSQTRAGMTARRAYLEGQPPSPKARDVIERQEWVARSLDRARKLHTLLDEAERYTRLVAHNEERVNLALAKINPNAVVQMQKLEAQRRESDDRLLQLAAERAALSQQLGGFGDGTTERALTTQLRDVMQRTGVSETDLSETFGEAESDMHRVQLRLTQARDKAAEVRRELLRAEVDVRRAHASLAEHDQVAWVRSTLQGTTLPSDTDTPLQQLTAIDAARQRVSTVNDRLGDLRGQLAALESALWGVGRHLRGQDPQAKEYVHELQSWFGSHFSDWFNDARVRCELLPTAEGEIIVDVSTREVVWSEHSGRRARPLEAFSSGEQAFAYTRARLAMLDEDKVKPSNRLIVLDEFGAFIAHDRLAGLLAYLQERANQHPEDQVLVVLPLSHDYAELARSALGSEVERFGKMAKEIAVRQYAVRPL